MTSDRYELHILGAPDLRAPDGRRLTSVLSQPSRLSLLAYLALAPGPVTRAAVVADFWPESDEARARNALSQAVFYLRRSLDKDTVRSVEGDRLWVPPERLWCDARTLLTQADPPEDVISAGREGLLTGWNADGSQPLQDWLDSHRGRVQTKVAELAGRESRGTLPSSDTEAPTELAPVPIPQSPRPKWLPSAIAATIVVLVLFAVVPPLARAPDRPSDDMRFGALGDSSAPERIIVLLPRVSVPQEETRLDADHIALTLNAQLIARLPERAGLEVVSAPFASSLQDLARQRTAIVGPDEELPAWILDVGVVVSRGTAHVTDVLYRGSDFGVPGREGFDLTFDGPEELAIAVPRAIAQKVAEMVDSVLSVTPAARQP